MIYSCCNENRKAAVRGNAAINGIDYLEVVDGPSTPAGSPRQQTLLITCLNIAPTTLKPGNVLITGGEGVTSIGVEWIAPAVPAPPLASPAEATYFAKLPSAANVLVARLNKYGDFSPYTLQLVNDAAAASLGVFPTTETLNGFDPQLSSVTFSFKVDCGPAFDCIPAPANCAAPPPTPPPINYLAKDYTTFRQVMLDRMNQLLPSWGASTEADIGVMLAEVVSYAADQLSYRQDAVTTEAYLNTARSRISLRRHARLVDYQVSEGCNARAWIQVAVSATTFLPRHGSRFYTTASGMPSSLAGNEQAALNAGVVVFEPMQEALLSADHNLIYFYTWGDTNCCLPTGSTKATLLGTFADLRVGDVLIFQEVLGPQTGVPGDADLRHRCAVRLNAVATTNAAGSSLVDPLFDINGNPITSSTQTPQPVTEIQWSTEDALPFPVCISSTIPGADNISTALPNVSIVLGNILLADNGLTMPRADLGIVPAPSIFYAPNRSAGQCAPEVKTPLPVRFLPRLADSPVTQPVPLPITGSPSTPDAIPLSATAPVTLKDGDGFITMQVTANSPVTWPQYFGVTATANATPGEFDLVVVFDPQPGGPAGMSGPVTLESFQGMNLTTASPNYAGTILANSQFIKVPSGPPPSTTVPTSFPAGPSMLPNTGALTLEDAGLTPYLTIQATNPLGWPPLFSLISQQQTVHPTHFNLLLLYTPPSGPEGVTPPVLVEQFPDLSLATVTTEISAASNLISVETFEGEPNPSLSVADLMQFDAHEAVPAVTLTSTTPGGSNPAVTWTPVLDLLGSGPEDTQFVMEIDTDGTAQLRFGDGTNGKLPVAGDEFTAVYRVGNGTAGNVGAGCLINCSAPVAVRATILNCTNPIAASGGIDPETAAQICRRAPQAFTTQERAITMQDYVNAVELSPQIEDAAAQPRWTGSWYTIFIAAEPQANAPLSKALRRSLMKTVNAYRLAGQATFIEPPQYVPLSITLTVCVDPNAFSADVRAALLQALGSCTLPSGAPAFFAPKNFELGQPVYLSTIYAAARTIPGVTRVTATVFEPQGENTRTYIQQGYIPMGPFQVARLDNDPSLPGNGILRLTMQGGR